MIEATSGRLVLLPNSEGMKRLTLLLELSKGKNDFASMAASSQIY